MAGRGPAPKDPEKRQRRNEDTIPTTELAPDAKPNRAPALPGARLLSAATRRWYRTWATSPQAVVFVATDWQRLHMLAPLVEAYFAEPKQTLLAEIRLNEQLLGATVVDRQRARMRITAEPSSGGAARRGPAGRSRPDPRRLAAVS